MLSKAAPKCWGINTKLLHEVEAIERVFHATCYLLQSLMGFGKGLGISGQRLNEHYLFSSAPSASARLVLPVKAMYSGFIAGDGVLVHPYTQVGKTPTDIG